MQTINFTQCGDNVIQVMMANRSFLADAKCINFTSDKVRLTSTSSFDQQVLVESEDLAYVNLSSAHCLNLIDVDSLPNQFTIHKEKVVACRGFKVKSTYKGFFTSNVVMEKVREESGISENRGLREEREEAYERRRLNRTDSQPCIQDSFLIVESDSQLVVKRLAMGETIKAKHYTVLITDIKEDTSTNNAQLDDLGFKLYKGPGILFIDPLKGKSQAIQEGIKTRSRLVYGRPVRARDFACGCCICLVFLLMTSFNLVLFNFIR